MKKGKLLMLGAFSLFVGVGNVSAVSFTDTDNNMMHIMEERQNVCGTEWNYETTLDSGTLVYSKSEYDTTTGRYKYEYAKVDNNKCVGLTNQETLDVRNTMYPMYNVQTDADGNLGIYSETLNYVEMGYIITNDTSVVAGKTYYDANKTVIDTTVNTDMSTYYEQVRFEYPKSATIDSNLTYYVNKGNNMYEKVINPVEADILDYYIVSDKESYTAKKEVAIDKAKYQELIDKYSMYYVTKMLNNYYFMMSNNGSGVYDAYDVNGNLVQEKVQAYAPYEEGYYGITNDNGYSMYNNKDKLLYSNKDLKYVFLDYYKDGKGIMIASGTNNSVVIDYQLVKLVKGDKQKYTDKEITFTFSDSASLFSKVLVNDKELASSAYTVNKDGSLTIENAYLNELKVGDYSVKFMHEDGGYVVASFSVVEDKKELEEDEKVLPVVDEENPKTSDNIGTTIMIGSVSFIGLVGGVLVLRRRA